MSRQDARWREAAGGSHSEDPLETALTLVFTILLGVVGAEALIIVALLMGWL